MSIQTTLEVTREQAFEKYFELQTLQFKKVIRRQFDLLSDEEIEDYIDEHFYNYKIVNK